MPRLPYLGFASFDEKMKKPYSMMISAVDGLVSISSELAAWTLLIMAANVTADVSMRYILGAGTKWAEEFTGYLLVLVVFFGLAYGQKEGAHLRIDLLVTRLPLRVRYWLDLISMTMFLSYAIFLCYLTWNRMNRTLTLHVTSQTGIDVIIWPFQLLMPIGLAILSLLLLVSICKKLKLILL